MAVREEDDRIPVHVPEDSLARRDPEKALQHQSSDELTLHDGGGESSKEVPRTRGKGLVEGDIDMQPIPENRLWLVMIALNLLFFVAALDMTVVVTALPTMADDLALTPAGYQWVGTAFLLGNAAFCPFYGRMSDITGRKPMLYAMTALFITFSAVCGAAIDQNTMIVGRAFQGAGGGGIFVLSMIIVSDITPLATRTVYLGLMNAATTISSILGPIIGGALSEKASWRWCFWINLPTCGVGVVLVAFVLNLNPRPPSSFRTFIKTFDFVGFIAIVVGVGLTVTGFALAADGGFNQPMSYSFIIAGVVLIGLAITNFIFTKRIPVIPPRLFQIRTTALFLIASFLQAIAFLPVMFLLPQLFQAVRGSSPLQAGIDIIPFCVSLSITVLCSGWIIARLRLVRQMAWAGYSLATIGFGLFYAYFDATAPQSVLLGLQVITGFGLGLSIQPQLIAMQAAMPLKEVGAVTSAYMLARPMGATIGLAIDQAVLNTGIRSRFEAIPGYGTVFEAPTNEAGYAALHALPEGSMKDRIMAAFADSMKVCWIIHIAVLLAALILTIPTREYSLDRQQGQKAAPSATTPSDVKAAESDPEAINDTPETSASDRTIAPADTMLQSNSARTAPPPVRPQMLTRSTSRASAIGAAVVRVASAAGARPIGPHGTGHAAALEEEEARRRAA